MKKQYTLLTFLFLSHFLFSQNINQEYIFSDRNFMEIFSSFNKDGYTYVGGSAESCQVGAVMKLDYEGNLIYNTSWDNGYWQVSEIEYRESDSLIIGCGYWLEADDYPSEFDSPYIFALDTDGNLVFENKLVEIYGAFSIEFVNKTSVAVLPNDKFVMAVNDELIWLDENGQLESFDSFDTSDFLGVDVLNDTTILLYNSTELFFLDFNGQLLGSEIFNEGISDIYFDDEKVFILKGDALDIYDIASGEITSTDYYLNFIQNPKGIEGNSSSIFLYEKNQDFDNDDEILQLNKNTLSIIGESVFDRDDAKLMFLGVTENELQLFGRENDYSSFVKSKPIDTTFQYEDIDIELSEITPLGSLSVVDSVFTGNGYLYEIEWIPIPFTFKVTNVGTKIINSFTLRTYNLGGLNCAVYVYFDDYDNLNIMPGESIVFEKTSYLVGGGYYENPYSVTSSINMKVFAPNHLFEADLSNNEASGVVYVTNTNELLSNIKSFNIFPNPAQEKLHLEALFIEKNKNEINISIFNSQGILVKHLIVDENNMDLNEQIDVSGLPNGLYSLSINSGREIISRKFMKII